jgi:hypothetical protein
LIGCGQHAAAPTESAHHDDTWAKLGFEDRHATMTFTVLPNMAHAWQSYAKTTYPTLTCRSCHGADAESVAYRMPNPGLPPIDPAHQPAGPAAAFMRSVVVPQMIDLIGTTPAHFSCNSCHPKAHR